MTNQHEITPVQLKGKSRQWVSKNALTLFKRAAMGHEKAKSIMVWCGLQEQYVEKLLDTATKQRRLAMDRKNERAKERRLEKKRVAKL